MSEEVITMLRRFLNRKKELAYIHVPKTGGTYLGQLQSDRHPVLPVRYLGHIYVTDQKKVPSPIYYPRDPQHYYQMTILLSKIQKYLVLSTVRNIFSWLVSYAWHAGGWNPKYHDPNHYDFVNANKSFDYLIKTIANREDLWPNRKFIFCQLFCNNGQLIVDWINRNETLDADLEILAGMHNRPYTKREKQRVGHETDYRTYYTDELIEIVYKTWGRELDLFGYDFDGVKPGSNSYYQAVNVESKNRVKYFWESDKLIVCDKTVER